MKTLGDVLKLATQYLKERNDARARRHAEDLLSFILKEPRLNLYLQFDRPLEENELAVYRELLKRKASGEPVEYICGSVAFAGCELEVSSDVLIPRPESEILLEKACQKIQQRQVAGRQAWDICCGSGCLGLGLKKRFPELALSLADISLKALEVARRNAERNSLSIEFFNGDLLQPFEDKKADIILCNPPYVSNKEFIDLDPSVKNFEPSLALIGGEKGTEFYERLSRQLPKYLHPQAMLFFEIGTGQGKDILDLFDAPYWKEKKVEKDWAGHDRFFFLEFE